MARRIKIEQQGDYAQKKTVPAIRLKGKWLERAGFMPGNHVQIVLHESGRMEVFADGQSLRTATESSNETQPT